MADFSEYTGPSEEWIAVERSLPPLPQDLTIEQLKDAQNKGREDFAAQEMVEQGLHPKVTLRDFGIPARDGFTIEARSYRPAGVGPTQRLPVYIHLHGGGFLFGTLSSEDASCARIVVSLAETGLPVVVVNVNYRHTPEYKYPTAWEDVEDAFHWIHDHIEAIGGDGANLVMGGISAGAWLTASTALAQHLGQDKELAARPRIKGQVLMIPPLVHYDCYESQLKRLRDPQVSSWVENCNAPFLPLERMKLFMKLLGIESVKSLAGDLRLNPGNATAEQVRGLPPVTFGIAGLDPLRDGALFYAQLLSETGVPTRTNVFKGVPHGFRRYGDRLSASKKWDEVMVEGIRFALSDPVPEPFVIQVF
ncbi:hypothetical protein ARAM_004673 [Aspergillus rambellii]|uniref:Alpha/beta hydrolase fold-3 domain-containing protein n=1 Tax=Aspergillus rambellii TaxID=308745 RepID=A0A0F8XC77_9EURO|nr:hypothetical protein ARAM_004673 [Aspergillus rambellii]